jgi:hypothetical protein
MTKSNTNSLGHLTRLALFTAIIGLFLFSWAKSYFFNDLIFYTRSSVSGRSLIRDKYQVRSSFGGFRLRWLRYRIACDTSQEASQEFFEYLPDDGFRWSAEFHPTYPNLGPQFDWVNSQRNARTMTAQVGAHTYELVVPYWAIACVASVPLAIVIVRSLRHRRVEPGQILCPKCGYDLRASQLRCPECGTLRQDMHAPIALS